jgi:flagellar hook-associated protein 1 FlgK
VSISSFYGLQTSLRGLLAQQRLLDTAGHNIANASTRGYSRQEVSLVASDALQIPAGGIVGGAGAHIGSGVDVQSYRRVRDQFVDLQYRAQNTNLQEWAARTKTLDRAELSLNEPGENGLNEQLARFWDSWSSLAGDAKNASLKQNVAETASSLAGAFQTLYDQIALTRDQAAAEYADLARPAGAGDPGGEIAQMAREIAQLNDSISRYITTGDIPNDLLDRRDLLLDDLSEFGQISVTEQPNGMLDVSFVDKVTAGATYSIVTGAASTWAGPPAGNAWAPGGRLGGLLEASRPGGTLDQYLGDLNTIASNLANAVNAVYPTGDFFTVGAPPAGAADTLAVNPALATNPTLIVGGTGNDGSSDVARAIAAIQNNPSSGVDGAYQAFVSKIGAHVRESIRQEANAQALTDAVENRRQSVAGVSMDEEMSNLVRFQRAYQASSRAMSTMDEMLDVLINRTGRVGL